MDFLLQGVLKAIELLTTIDPETFSAVYATLVVSTYSLSATLFMGLPLGFGLGYFDFKAKKQVRVVVDTLLALPTVFIGLLVYAFIVASLFEKRAAGVYHNTAAIIDADGLLLGTYRKMHIPDDPLYYEKFYFTPGDLGFRAWQTRYGKIGVLICWDQWYPEGARLTALQGAQVLFYPTAIGWHPAEKQVHGRKQHEAWELIQRSHAVANGCYVAVANRIGHERPVGGEGIEFWGQSFVAGPSGEILAKAGAQREEVLIVPVDLAQVDGAPGVALGALIAGVTLLVR